MLLSHCVFSWNLMLIPSVPQRRCHMQDNMLIQLSFLTFLVRLGNLTVNLTFVFGN